MISGERRRANHVEVKRYYQKVASRERDERNGNPIQKLDLEINCNFLFSRIFEWISWFSQLIYELIDKKNMLIRCSIDELLSSIPIIARSVLTFLFSTPWIDENSRNFSDRKNVLSLYLAYIWQFLFYFILLIQKLFRFKSRLTNLHNYCTYHNRRKREIRTI